MNLAFTKNKGLSIVLLLVCIFGALIVDIMMKPLQSMEGFEEGAKNKNASNETELKSEINAILSSSSSTKIQSNEILQVIGLYLKDNPTNTTITQIMIILSMDTTNDKKMNLIGVLLTSDKL
jgi:hypothetical protein